MTLTNAELVASDLHDRYGAGTIDIMRAYGHARDRGLDKQTAWFYVEQWLIGLERARRIER